MSFCGLIKGISPKNVHIILCVRVKINKRSFEPFLCLDHAWLLVGLYIRNADVHCYQLSSLDAGVAVQHSKLSLRADGQVDPPP